MPKKKKAGKPYLHYHKDGSLWAKGAKVGDTMTGYRDGFGKARRCGLGILRMASKW
jgi:hypothetical protein